MTASQSMLLLVNFIVGVSVDCPNMINLAQGMNMNISQPSVMSQLMSDCCTAPGVTCDGNQRVTLIKWKAYGLSGFLNGTAIPSKLINLQMDVNDVGGPLPIFPDSLTNLNVAENRFTSLPASWPPQIFQININSNGLSGPIPSFPPSLSDLAIGWAYDVSNFNQFSGVLRLFKPVFIDIHYNLLTDVIINDTLLLTAGNCDLSNNPMFGSPNLVPLSMCVKNDLYVVGAVSLTEGQSVKCGGVSRNEYLMAVYRYTCSMIRHYPNPTIASSWDTQWTQYKMIDCSGVTIGPDMALKLVNDITTCANSLTTLTTSNRLTMQTPTSIAAKITTMTSIASKITTMTSPTLITTMTSIAAKDTTMTSIALISTVTRITSSTFRSTLDYTDALPDARTTNQKYGQFGQNANQLVFTVTITLRVVLHELIDILILGFVLRRAPFMRELKRKLKKIRVKESAAHSAFS